MLEVPPMPREPTRMAPSDTFTPTRPKPGRRNLVGRKVELERIMQALRHEKAHVVLYSERGRGKTSLSNMVMEALRRSEMIVARYTCEAGSSFDTAMRGLARDLPPSLLVDPAEDGTGEGCEPALPRYDLRPRDIVELLPRLGCRNLVCLIDEFDRIEDLATRTRLADTIKQVSDRGIALSFMIVGVSENLDQILGQHPSIQRNVVAVHLSLLSDEEIAALLAIGGRDAGLTFTPPVIAQIAVIARGMPYMAQLLGLRVAQAAFQRDATSISEEDFLAGVDRLIADARQSVSAAYARLTDSGRDAEMVASLRRIATAEQDSWGRLQIVVGPGNVSIGGRSITGECWEKLLASGVLRLSEDGPDLVLFEDRGLLTYILLWAARSETLLDGWRQGSRSGADVGAPRLHVAASRS